MKHIKHLFIALLMTITFGFVSCSKEPIQNNDKLIYSSQGVLETMNEYTGELETIDYGVALSINENIYNELSSYYSELAIWNENDTVYLIYYGDAFTALENMKTCVKAIESGDTYTHYQVGNYYIDDEWTNQTINWTSGDYGSIEFHKVFKISQKKYHNDYGVNGLPAYDLKTVYINDEQLEKIYIAII